MNLAWRWKLALILGALGSVVGCKTPMAGGSNLTSPSASANSGGGAASAVSKAWKSTSSTVASALTIKPKTDPADDPTSLETPAKVSANTHLATGRLLESRQDFGKAQAEYEKAIEIEPGNLMALVSLARLQDRQQRPDQAIVTYHKALKAHPKSALVHNDLGLCYARKRDLPSAVSMLHKAVEMEPTKPNYRNNLATVLVEAGRTEEALKHLQAVHAPAEAHFNLAYLLNHRGQTDMARRLLAQAISLDPTFTRAQEMLAQLDGNAAGQAAAAAPTQVAADSPTIAQSEAASADVSLNGPYQTGGSPEAYPAPSEVPVQTAEPVYHIGSEGIESSPADSPGNYQPTSQQYPAGPSQNATSFHLDDGGEEALLVVTHLVYGTDKDPAPEPAGLIDDEPNEVPAEPAAETAPGPVEEVLSEEPTNVKPVSKLPTLYPIAP